MISSFEAITALLEELDASLRSEIRLFMIGGVTWVGERLDLLQEKEVNIPFMRELDALREEWYSRAG